MKVYSSLFNSNNSFISSISIFRYSSKSTNKDKKDNESKSSISFSFSINKPLF
ncbi:hypothetical protein KX935_03390 [Streptobacillus moniliformis]|nr:hypothetical protein KX935_03390 [Streptobacillus moniliformis]